LYKKYGFAVVNTRRGYYSDNDENALVMWAGNLKGAIYRNRLATLKESLN
jgi:ribosomal-protein-alanine N-acetyltransferase